MFIPIESTSHNGGVPFPPEAHYEISILIISSFVNLFIKYLLLDENISNSVNYKMQWVSLF